MKEVLEEPATETSSLTDSQRQALEKTVVSAREAAEQGARAALDRLGVGAAEPFDHLTHAERDLRRRLRARARQLGDERQSDGTHETEHLVREVAYEHWHRMLFARFLAENDLLMHPDGVPVTLEECEELAEAEDVRDGWELAGRYAARMLPQIFRPDAAALQVQLAPEYCQELEKLLEGLDPAIFTARDALGWVYQYWQSKRKDEVNASGVKIGADELPAVTQLFTEPYMVKFLLQNSLGAWWVTRHPNDELPVKMPYLRRAGAGTPGMGKAESWPDRAAKLKVLDPCCGSGHFLVEALHLLVPMRMTEEGLSARKACDAVIEDNLYGLEIDQRCTEIAAFAVALAAWTFPGAEGYRELPEMHIACSGLSVGGTEEEWLAYGGDDERLQRGMRRLYRLFNGAPTLGSLIDPAQDNGDLFEAPYDELEPLLQQALEEEDPDDYQAHEIGVTAQGLAKAAQLLASEYHLVTTNVPYLHRSKQDGLLRDYTRDEFYEARKGLATTFLMRAIRFCSSGSTVDLVLPHTWLNLVSYESLRRTILTECTIQQVAFLGSNAFRTSLWDFNIILLSLSPVSPTPSDEFIGIDASDSSSTEEVKEQLRRTSVTIVRQASQYENPDARITLTEMDSASLLSNYAYSYHGQGTRDSKRFIRQWWEIDAFRDGWEPMQTTVKDTRHFGGLERALFWENGEGAFAKFIERWEELGSSSPDWDAGVQIWGEDGIAVSQMGQLKVSLYLGTSFDSNTAVVVPDDEDLLLPIWCFLSSDVYNQEVRRIDKKVNVTNATLTKVPFDVEYWQKVAAEKYPNGLPEPHSRDPTQWICEGIVSASERPLQVAVARLLGYEWPEQAEDGLAEVTDDDGIVCIPPVGGEQPAASRLRGVLARAYGSNGGVKMTETLLSEVGFEEASLEEWLRDGFFEQHCDLFEHRPFIWHIWDGRHDGFGALVNYHELDRPTLERLTYTYLGDWIHRQKKEVKQDRDTAEARLHAAQHLQEQLELILKGEQPYDIFVRWKPIEEQPIGWEPDLDDGVRQNIRPFVKADVLRKTPNVKWTNDRGKEPEGALWYEEFDGKRVNDHHLSLEEKQAARKGEVR